MEVLTNETYYNILEKCAIEAFETLAVKDFYPNNGTKAGWDVSSLIIQKGDGLPNDNDNELFRKSYIKENMTVTFLMALDRYWKDFEIKYSITRSFFYKKCYQSLLFKTSESPLWNKPNFGFDINEPCALTFIWNMSGDIEARSVDYQQPKANKPNVKESKSEKLDAKVLEFNLNHWNKKTFQLFNYLVENYEKKGNVKYINIFEFLKNADKQVYAFNFTHDTYRKFIIEKYGIKVTKIKVAEFEYIDKEEPILKSWEVEFSAQNK